MPPLHRAVSLSSTTEVDLQLFVQGDVTDELARLKRLRFELPNVIIDTSTQVILRQPCCIEICQP